MVFVTPFWWLSITLVSSASPHLGFVKLSVHEHWRRQQCGGDPDGRYHPVGPVGGGVGAQREHHRHEPPDTDRRECEHARRQCRGWGGGNNRSSYISFEVRLDWLIELLLYHTRYLIFVDIFYSFFSFI